jgi:hypothetical protein
LSLSGARGGADAIALADEKAREQGADTPIVVDDEDMRRLGVVLCTLRQLLFSCARLEQIRAGRPWARARKPNRALLAEDVY